ncbi:hypothetical protein U9M48_032983 [Paspalum notatum var. saurae]|uniref:Ubiquitin-like domain-containing protein n=1 Tax=Paspalum notatum var. saurae TaxID=547442 RepID=A0AAQ3U9M9_PASNO
MIKLRCSKKLFRKSSSKDSTASSSSSDGGDAGSVRGEIEWEVRPGGMLVQKRDGRGDVEVITVRVATGFSWHDVSIGATCTFGELKVVVSLVTGLEPREQRLLFRGKEREDSDHLHMIGVRDMDKVLLLEDPALKDMKLRAGLVPQQAVQSPYRPFIKLRCSKKLFRRSSSKGSTSSAASSSDGGDAGSVRGEIQWEVRPGGMLVQKRDGRGDVEVITVRVATGFSWHDVSIGATSTFEELKAVVSMATGLEPREQRLLFRGKEREDGDRLHMVGVRDRDKVLLLEDPALKDLKLRAALAAQAPYRPFIKV